MKYLVACIAILLIIINYKTYIHHRESERKRWYNIGFERAKSLNKFEANTNCAEDYYSLDSLTVNAKLQGK